MELRKAVTSRKGNKYIVDLYLEGGEIKTFNITNLQGENVLCGSGEMYYTDSKDENYIVNAIKDLILFVEEKYYKYETVKTFEEWDGVIK